MSVAELAPGDAYKLLTGLVVPRPIGWIGSVSTNGIPNLAPYSFFNAVASRPPTLIVAPGLHEGHYKDTLRNLVDTGEFTVNVVSAELAEQMNVTSTTSKEDEFDRAGLTAVPGVDVAAPLVAECKANFECRVTRTVEIGDEEPTAVVVFGEIVRFHIQESIVNERFHVDPLALAPVGRLAGPNYANVTNTYQMIRPD
ncbi:MAG: flavin reductase family protein, partial [Acidimicrobiia bacterium]|nr:flavin reductase family protein [Acidimicrobiia bacterium]